MLLWNTSEPLAWRFWRMLRSFFLLPSISLCFFYPSFSSCSFALSWFWGNKMGKMRCQASYSNHSTKGKMVFYSFIYFEKYICLYMHILKEPFSLLHHFFYMPYLSCFPNYTSHPSITSLSFTYQICYLGSIGMHSNWFYRTHTRLRTNITE